MARPRTRSPNAKPLQVWLEPEELEALGAYVAVRGLKTNAEGIRVLIRAAGDWAARGGKPKRAAKPERPPEPEAEPVEEDTCPEVRQAREVIRGERPSDLPEGVIYGIPPSVIRAEEERRRLWREAQERAEQMTEEEIEGWDEAAQEAWQNDRR